MTIGTNNFYFKIGSTNYSAEVTSIVENPTTTGGEEIRTATTSYKTPIASAITSITVTMVQTLESSGLFGYLRENTSAGTEVVMYSLGTTVTPAASNPVWSATATGWSKPALTGQAEGGYPTATAEISFSAAPVVDYTP